MLQVRWAVFVSDVSERTPIAGNLTGRISPHSAMKLLFAIGGISPIQWARWSLRVRIPTAVKSLSGRLLNISTRLVCLTVPKLTDRFSHGKSI